MLFCHWKCNFRFGQATVQCLFHFFPPHGGITYIFYLIAEAFFKSPFHKNDLFQLCLLGKKTTNRQVLKKKRRNVCLLAQQFLIQVSLSLLFSSLFADTKNAHGRLEIYVLCSLEKWLHKSTKQSFLFICLSLTGKWRSEADAIATWTSCLNTESIFSFQKEVG